MFERFSEPARMVMVVAQDEARGMGHGYLGDEHLLLAGLSEDASAADELASQGATDHVLRTAIDEISPPGKLTSGQIPFTYAAKRTLEMAAREASDEIHPRDLVIGALEQSDGAVAKLLDRLGIEREAVTNALRSPPER